MFVYPNGGIMSSRGCRKMALVTYLDTLFSGMKARIDPGSQLPEQPDNWKPFLAAV
jgi:hypothetical protein